MSTFFSGFWEGGVFDGGIPRYNVLCESSADLGEGDLVKRW